MEAPDKAKVRAKSHALPLLFVNSEIFLAAARDREICEAVSEDTLRWNMRLRAPGAPAGYNKYRLLCCLYTKKPLFLYTVGGMGCEQV